MPWAHANGSLEWAEILWKVAFHKYKRSHGLFFTLLSYVFEKRVVQVKNQFTHTAIWSSQNWGQEFCAHSEVVWLRVSVKSCTDANWAGGSIELLLDCLSPTVWKWQLNYYTYFCHPFYQRKIEIRHIKIKMVITSERFELEPRIECHSTSLTETHVSGKLQSDRSGFDFCRISEQSWAKSTIFLC